MRIRKLGYAVPAALLAFTLTACGDDGGSEGGGGGGSETDDTSAQEDFATQSAEDIKQAAVDAMSSLDSLRMEGTIESDDGDIDLNVALDTNGNCEGTFTTQGATASLIAADGNSYLKADEKFWQVSTGDDAQGSQIAEVVGDRWALMPPDSGFEEICDLDNLLEDFTDTSDDDDSQIEVGDQTDVDGTPAVELTVTKDEETTTAYVGTEEDKHYILQIEGEGGDSSGTVTLSEFNEEVQAEAPAESDVVDLNEI